MSVFKIDSKGRETELRNLRAVLDHIDVFSRITLLPPSPQSSNETRVVVELLNNTQYHFEFASESVFQTVFLPAVYRRLFGRSKAGRARAWRENGARLLPTVVSWEFNPAYRPFGQWVLIAYLHTGGDGNELWRTLPVIGE